MYDMSAVVEAKWNLLYGLREHMLPPSYTMYCMYFISVFDNILLPTVADYYQSHINKKQLIKFHDLSFNWWELDRDVLFSLKTVLAEMHSCAPLSKTPFNLSQHLIKRCAPCACNTQMALLCGSGCISLCLRWAAHLLRCASAVAAKEAVTAIMHHTLIWQTHRCRVGLCLCIRERVRLCVYVVGLGGKACLVTFFLSRCWGHPHHPRRPNLISSIAVQLLPKGH